jgi:hypothetical protein
MTDAVRVVDGVTSPKTAAAPPLRSSRWWLGLTIT